MKTDAARQTLAAPPVPCAATAAAMNGTVALAVPPIKTGLRPSSEVTGAVRIEVKSPSSGGKPHHPRQGQAVGERNQRGDGAAHCVSCQVVPAIAFGARPRRPLRQLRHS